MKTYVINKVEYQVSDEKFNYNTQTELNPEATLREIKEKVGSTRGFKRAPRTRFLRCCGELVAATTAGECRMEVYSNGFAIYQTQDTAVVIRMEYVGQVRYESEPEIELYTQNIDLMDEAWKVAVLMRAEDRLEKWAGERDADILVPWSEAGDVDEETGEVSELEVDADVDIEEEILQQEEAEELLELLSSRQRECAEMYYGLGMTHREIGRVLGITHQSVDLTLKGARKRVKKFFEKNE